MKKQNQSEVLLANIALLKAKRRLEVEILKTQLHTTYQSLHPLNLIKDFFADKCDVKSKTTNSFGEKIIGIASSYISNKMVVGASKNLLKNSIGGALQLMAAQSVANNTGAINKGIVWLFQRVMRKKNVA